MNPRKSDNAKIAAGTFRNDRSLSTPAPAALSTWPRAPSDFSDAEKKAWRKLGRCLLPLGTVGQADLLICEYACKVMCRVDAGFQNPNLKTTTLASLIRLLSDLLKALGLSPAARRAVEALPVEQDEEDDDPTSEFSVS